MNRKVLALAIALLPLNACVPPAATAGADAEVTVPPPADGDIALLNRAEATRLMDARYDPLLRDAGVTGTVDLDVTLNADGSVRETRVVDTTHSRFSQSARQVAPTLRFTPPAQAGAVLRVQMRFVYGRGEIEVVGVGTGS